MADVYSLRARRWLTPAEVADRSLPSVVVHRQDVLHICCRCAGSWKTERGYNQHHCQPEEVPRVGP